MPNRKRRWRWSVTSATVQSASKWERGGQSSAVEQRTKKQEK